MDDKVKAKIMSFFKSVNVSKSFSLQWNNFQKKCEFSQKCQFFKILWVPYWSGSYKFDVSDILYTDLWCPKVQYCLFSKMTSSSPVNSLLPPSVLVLYELSRVKTQTCCQAVDLFSIFVSVCVFSREEISSCTQLLCRQQAVAT